MLALLLSILFTGPFMEVVEAALGLLTPGVEGVSCALFVSCSTRLKAFLINERV